MEPHVGISVPVKRESRACTLCLVKTQQKDGSLQTRKKALNRTGSASNLILDFSASRMMRNRCLKFEPPSPWYFVVTAWTKPEEDIGQKLEQANFSEQGMVICFKQEENFMVKHWRRAFSLPTVVGGNRKSEAKPGKHHEGFSTKELTFYLSL